MSAFLTTVATGEAAGGQLLPPVDAQQEVWAAGVTYLRSRDARQAESKAGDVYQRVYDAERPEVFFKASGWRVQGARHARPRARRQPLERARAGAGHRHQRWRRDRRLHAPATTCHRATSRARIRSTCRRPRSMIAPAPSVPASSWREPSCLRDLPIEVTIVREGAVAFQGQRQHGADEAQGGGSGRLPAPRRCSSPTASSSMTGTCVVPPDSFSLRPGDRVLVNVGALALQNDSGLTEVD